LARERDVVTCKCGVNASPRDAIVVANNFQSGTAFVALCATLTTIILGDSMSDSNTPEQQGPRIPFPSNQPRVWFLTAGCNPTAASIARHLLEHGDSVVAGIHPSEYFSTGSHKEDFGQLLNDVSSNQEWKARLRVIRFDFRYDDCVYWDVGPGLETNLL